jgi:hypothetical protein
VSFQKMLHMESGTGATAMSFESGQSGMQSKKQSPEQPTKEESARNTLGHLRGGGAGGWDLKVMTRIIISNPPQQKSSGMAR